MPDHDLEGGFVVTPRDIYDEIRAVRTIVEPLPARVTELEKGRDDHERRIRRLEGLSSRLSGAKGLLMWAGGGIGAAALVHFVH